MSHGRLAAHGRPGESPPGRRAGGTTHSVAECAKRSPYSGASLVASFSLPCRLPPFHPRSAVLIVTPKHYHKPGLRSTSRLSDLRSRDSVAPTRGEPLGRRIPRFPQRVVVRGASATIRTARPKLRRLRRPPNRAAASTSRTRPAQRGAHSQRADDPDQLIGVGLRDALPLVLGGSSRRREAGDADERSVTVRHPS
jgi:hypothetical protein